jgi:hypothetical protein
MIKANFEFKPDIITVILIAVIVLALIFISFDKWKLIFDFILQLLKNKK